MNISFVKVRKIIEVCLVYVFVFKETQALFIWSRVAELTFHFFEKFNWLFTWERELVSGGRDNSGGRVVSSRQVG